MSASEDIDVPPGDAPPPPGGIAYVDDWGLLQGLRDADWVPMVFYMETGGLDIQEPTPEDPHGVARPARTEAWRLYRCPWCEGVVFPKDDGTPDKDGHIDYHAEILSRIRVAAGGME